MHHPKSRLAVDGSKIGLLTHCNRRHRPSRVAACIGSVFSMPCPPGEQKGAPGLGLFMSAGAPPEVLAASSQSSKVIVK